jgi:hypothetical protein
MTPSAGLLAKGCTTAAIDYRVFEGSHNSGTRATGRHAGRCIHGNELQRDAEGRGGTLACLSGGGLYPQMARGEGHVPTVPKAGTSRNSMYWATPQTARDRGEGANALRDAP